MYYTKRPNFIVYVVFLLEGYFLSNYFLSNTNTLKQTLQNNMLPIPKSLELDNFVFNPIATINSCPTLYLVNREEHDIQDAMKKINNGFEENAEKRKFIPRYFKQDSRDGKLFQQKNEEKSMIVTKVTSYQLKISHLIDELGENIRKSPKFVDPTDVFKQRKLFADFIIRFSRNYVYETDRIIDEIRFYQIDHYSYFERSTNHLINKVCNLFAIITRALQIYQKQLMNMSNENSDKLLQYMELIVSGINLCIEMKIFDENDMLIKLLLEKSDEFITLLKDISYNEESSMVKNVSSTSLTKDIFVPTNHRYIMYASTTKKTKPTKSMSVTKTNRHGKCTSTGRSSTTNHNQHLGKFKKMFESTLCPGYSENSSACDAYQEAIKQNQLQFNDLEEDEDQSLTDSEIEHDLELCLGDLKNV